MFQGNPPSFTIFLIDNILRMALNIAFDVIYSDVHDALARGLRRPGYVGRDDRVLCSLERVVRPDRLSGNDIEACCKHFSAVQGVGQVLLDDQLAAAVVDQDDAVFHFGWKGRAGSAGK